METWDRLGPPLIVGVTVGVVYVASNEILGLLAAWTLLSIPIGALVGHCLSKRK